jgi:hypothetical protein
LGEGEKGIVSMAYSRAAEESHLVSGLLRGAGNNCFGWRRERGFTRWFLAEIEDNRVKSVADMKKAPQDVVPMGTISVTGAEKIQEIIRGWPSCVIIV